MLYFSPDDVSNPRSSYMASTIRAEQVLKIGNGDRDLGIIKIGEVNYHASSDELAWGKPEPTLKLLDQE